MLAPCPCGSNVPFSACCEPLILGAPAPTAESLMRSRYTAYVLKDAYYLARTTTSNAAPDIDELQESMENLEWLSLEIVTTEDGGPNDSTGIVEFIATYQERGEFLQLHERSGFVRVNGVWAYDPSLSTFFDG